MAKLCSECNLEKDVNLRPENCIYYWECSQSKTDLFRSVGGDCNKCGIKIYEQRRDEEKKWSPYICLKCHIDNGPILEE